MASEQAISLIEQQDWIGQVGDALQPAIKDAFKAGGSAGQEVKNFLHGVWLGHPLHPVVTDIPIGAWTTAFALDVVESVRGHNKFSPGADAAITIGLVGAVGAAVSGITDWSETYGRGQKVGLAHGLLNAGATVCYATSLLLRKRNARRAGIGAAMLGYVVANAAAYLGGHLVYGEQIGVDHTAAQELPGDFVPVMAENELPENKLTRVEAKGVPVLLVRRHGEIHALAHTCSHLGGPLSEGKLEDDSVRCPWHGSRFSLEDGHVLEGPATYPQPCFEVRTRDGQIEVRSTKK